MNPLDTPDLAEALAHDTDGSFRRSALAYFEHWRERVRQAKQAGLPPSEFEALSRLDDSLLTASRLVEIFSRVKPAL